MQRIILIFVAAMAVAINLVYFQLVSLKKELASVRAELYVIKANLMIDQLERDLPAEGSVSDVLLVYLHKAYAADHSLAPKIEAALTRLEDWYSKQDTEYARMIKGWGWFDHNVAIVRSLYNPKFKLVAQQLHEKWWREQTKNF